MFPCLDVPSTLTHSQNKRRRERERPEAATNNQAANVECVSPDHETRRRRHEDSHSRRMGAPQCFTKSTHTHRTEHHVNCKVTRTRRTHTGPKIDIDGLPVTKPLPANVCAHTLMCRMIRRSSFCRSRFCVLCSAGGAPQRRGGSVCEWLPPASCVTFSVRNTVHNRKVY